MAKLIELRDVYKIYSEGLESEVRALDGVSLSIEKGEFVAIVGQSGSGKSTMMNVLGCLDVPTYGEYLLEGTDVSELSDMQLSRIRNKEIGFIFQQYNLIQDLTVLENLKIGAYLRRDKAEIEKDIQWVYSLFPRLEERSWQLAGTLSGGEQQMLAVGRALMSRPKLMMLDEPSLGLAPLVVQDIFSIIREINRQGVTVLLVEQNANMALKIADLAYVLETGTITMSGTGAELLADSRVKEAYLGKSS